MNSTVLGSGGYASVRTRTLAIKEYNSRLSIIARDAIREASILNHLNDCSVAGVPRLYSMNYYNGNTEATMSIVGTTLSNYMSRIDNLVERCNFIELYLPKIIEVIGNIHQAGIIHNDINLKNIMIDEDDEVHIIDFGLSTFGDIPYDGDVYSYTGTSYELDNNAGMFMSPELYHYGRTNYSTDYWMLAAWIVNSCSGVPNYIPINPHKSVSADDESVEWSNILMVLVNTYSKEDLEEDEIRSGIIIPDTITRSLAELIYPMLQLDMNLNLLI